MTQEKKTQIFQSKEMHLKIPREKRSAARTGKGKTSIEGRKNGNTCHKKAESFLLY